MSGHEDDLKAKSKLSVKFFATQLRSVIQGEKCHCCDLLSFISRTFLSES